MRARHDTTRRVFAGTADEGPGLCHVEVLNTEVVNTPSFFVAGAPLSDHYGLATTFRVAV